MDSKMEWVEKAHRKYTKINYVSVCQNKNVECCRDQSSQKIAALNNQEGCGRRKDMMSVVC